MSVAATVPFGENGRDNAEAETPVAVLGRVRAAMAQVLVGQTPLVDRLLVALITGGHVLCEGVPGLAKTLAARLLARAVGMSWQRIAFTPDLVPADLLGTEVYQPTTGTFTLRRGPIFAHLVVADEINRAPGKVQSALLEAMQERQVTLGTETLPLPDPFLVVATQNPLEHEGTYPLPEAQLDRFLMKVVVDYPSRAEERQMLDRLASTEGDRRAAAVPAVLDAAAVRGLRAAVDAVYVAATVADYVLELSRATRPQETDSPVADLVEVGVSPRGTLSILLAAKGWAVLAGRDYVVPHDVKSVYIDVCRHRLRLTLEAEAAGTTADAVLQQVLHTVPVP